MSIIAYVVSNVLHEAVGHGGTCLLLGGDPTALSTAYFDMTDGSVSPVGRRLVAAGGTVVNIIAGGLFWIALRSIRSRGGIIRYFFWLSMTINLLAGTGYFLFSGVTQVGDWVVVIRDFKPFWLWNGLLILIGLTTYLLCIRLALSTLLPLVGHEDTGRLKRAGKLTVFPYLVGSIAASAGAILNPISTVFVLTSAAANFGGTSGLAWMTQLYKRPWFKPADVEPMTMARSWGWIATAVVVLLGHILVLGPSLTF